MRCFNIKKKISKPSKNNIYKDNDSDITISFINLCKNNIFKSLINKNNYYKFKKIHILKHYYNNNHYIIVNTNNIKLIKNYNININVIIVNKINIKEIKTILQIYELNDNIIICSINNNYKYNILNIPIFKFTNNNNLFNTLENFTNVKNVNIYSKNIESSIDIIKNYLDKYYISYNNKYLSKQLLLSNFKDLFFKLENDYILYNIIQTEKMKFYNVKDAINIDLLIKSIVIYNSILN